MLLITVIGYKYWKGVTLVRTPKHGQVRAWPAKASRVRVAPLRSPLHNPSPRNKKRDGDALYAKTAAPALAIASPRLTAPRDTGLPASLLSGSRRVWEEPPEASTVAAAGAVTRNVSAAGPGVHASNALEDDMVRGAVPTERQLELVASVRRGKDCQ